MREAHLLEYLSGVEDVVRIEGFFQQAAQGEGGGVQIHADVGLFGQADAVLAGDAAVESHGGLEDFDHRLFHFG